MGILVLLRITQLRRLQLGCLGSSQPELLRGRILEKFDIEHYGVGNLVRFLAHADVLIQPGLQQSILHEDVVDVILDLDLLKIDLVILELVNH